MKKHLPTEFEIRNLRTATDDHKAFRPFVKVQKGGKRTYTF